MLTEVLFLKAETAHFSGPVCSYAVSAITEAGTTTTTTVAAATTTKAKKEEIDRRPVDDKTKAAPAKDASDEDDDDDDDDDSSEEDSAVTTAADSSVDSATLPFRVEVAEKSNGRAIIRLKDDAILDCSRPSYKFKIAPKRCGDEEIIGDR